MWYELKFIYITKQEEWVEINITDHPLGTRQINLTNSHELSSGKFIFREIKQKTDTFSPKKGQAGHLLRIVLHWLREKSEKELRSDMMPVALSLSVLWSTVKPLAN